jgi:hypothetical protein
LHPVHRRSEGKDANSNHEGTTQQRSGQEHTLPRVHSRSQAMVQIVESSLIPAPAIRTGTKQGVNCGSATIFIPCDLLLFRRGPAGEVQFLVQIFPEWRESVHFDRQPDPKSPKCLRKIRRISTGIHKILIFLSGVFRPFSRLSSGAQGVIGWAGTDARKVAS